MHIPRLALATDRDESARRSHQEPRRSLAAAALDLGSYPPPTLLPLKCRPGNRELRGVRGRVFVNRDRAMSKIERVSYGSGFVKRLRESRRLPAITVETADLPEDVLALLDHHLLDLGGTYGDTPRRAAPSRAPGQSLALAMTAGVGASLTIN